MPRLLFKSILYWCGYGKYLVIDNKGKSIFQCKKLYGFILPTVNLSEWLVREMAID